MTPVVVVALLTTYILGHFSAPTTPQRRVGLVRYDTSPLFYRSISFNPISEMRCASESNPDCHCYLHVHTHVLCWDEGVTKS